MIAIVSYGVGNVRAYMNLLGRHGIQAVPADTADSLYRASHIILPGVGAFDWAMEKLEVSGLRPHLDDIARAGTKPILGVCVGLQMMLSGSDEGSRLGLGWIPGRVRRLVGSGTEKLDLPHMGWNDVTCVPDSLFEHLAQAKFYFLHSYVVDVPDSLAIGHAIYGSRFVCAARLGSICGVQFHPEKSHDAGETLLANFAQSS